MVKNMKNKEKYNLSHLHMVERESETELFMGLNHVEIEYDGKIVKEYVCVKGTEIRCFLEWLEEEYKPTILTEKEKAYLSAIIKPFRKDIEHITKMETCYSKKQFIAIEVNHECILFPSFVKGTMYKGMKNEKRYTLEELGL